MNRTVQQYFSYLLLLCVLATVIPFNLFHDHEEHEHAHCDETDLVHESDPCHISIYHNESEGCEHKSHITEVEEECDLCEFITAQRYQYTVNDAPIVAPEAVAQDLPMPEADFLLWSAAASINGRAPPIC